jgi:DNA-binding NarL/FixJ family response regulator
MTQEMKKTFIVADNQDITRMGLHGYINSLFADSEIIDVKNKKELLTEVSAREDAVVILDYTLFDINGLDDFLNMSHRYTTSWVLFSAELSENFICRLGVEKNVSVILKDNLGDEICSALRCAANGERFLCHQISNLLIMGPDKPEVRSVLTPSEIEILKLIAKGKSAKEIAAERISSIHTIITHKKNIFRKLEVNNVYEATKYALRAGLIEMVEYYI